MLLFCYCLLMLGPKFVNPSARCVSGGYQVFSPHPSDIRTGWFTSSGPAVKIIVVIFVVAAFEILVVATAAFKILVVSAAAFKIHVVAAAAFKIRVVAIAALRFLLLLLLL